MEIDFYKMLPDSLKRLYRKQYGNLSENGAGQIEEFCKELKNNQSKRVSGEYKPDEEILQIQAQDRVDELSHEVRLIIANLIELEECTWAKGIHKHTAEAIINHQKLIQLTKGKDYNLIVSSVINNFFKYCKGNHKLPPEITGYIENPSAQKLNAIILKKRS